MAIKPRNYLRMLRPDGSRVDVANELVKAKLADGYLKDPTPDDRPELISGLVGKYRGRAALVVASGPSVAIAGHRAIEDFRRRHKPVVWAVNDVWRVVNGDPLPAADYLVVLDEEFYNNNGPRIREYLAEFPGCLLVTPFTVAIPRYIEIPIELGSEPHTGPEYRPCHYFHGSSSGVAAVQMAMQAGCNPVCLLGHDLTTYKGSSHGFGKRNADEVRSDYGQKSMMFPAYDLLARHCAPAGCKIVNLSTISAIRSFPFASIDL